MIKMPDFTVTGIVTIDNTASLLSVDEVMDAAEKASQKLAILRRKALSTISMTMGMVNQAYSVIKRLVDHTGGTIDPIFDAMFTTVSAVTSTAIAAALMLSSSMHPALITIGVTLMIISLELQIKTNMELEQARKEVKSKIYSVPPVPPEFQMPRTPTGGSF